MEKADKEMEEKENQQKAIQEEIILNEKQQMRLELERLEEGKLESRISEGEFEQTHVLTQDPEVNKQVTEEDKNRETVPADLV